MGVARYLWLIATTAFRHSVGISEKLLFGAVALAGSATVVAKNFAPDLVRMIPDVSTAEVTALVLAAIVLARSVASPYWVFQEQQRKIAALEVASPAAALDLRSWAELDPIKLGQAAFLWCDLAPAGSVHEGPPQVTLAFSKLRLAVEQERLTPDWSNSQITMFHFQRRATLARPSSSDIQIDEDTPVRIAELKKHAMATGANPSFLGLGATPA